MARRTLYRHADSEGVIEVVQEPSGVRTLHFGSVSKQSSLDPQEPHWLVLPYTRILTAALLFRPEPRRILLLGLGGGALAHFFLHHFPAAQVEAVESWPRVVSVARDFFALAEDDPRLRIHLAEAGAFIADPGPDSPGAWDLVVADVFDARGPAAGTLARAFYGGIQQRLEEGGVMAANLWSSNRLRLNGALKAMSDAFGRPVYRLQPRGRANVAAFAGRPPLPQAAPDRMGRRAQELADRIGLDYRRYLGDMEAIPKGWLTGRLASPS
ncbi:hypothetical protein [Thiohalorhabdus sp.]|uniref:spermine/spermidine synthase domain-containing protein n=1 Tax=Thiohalorhabdus sp. TaxID=3094134 RepID=UPI002FC344AF